MASADVVEGPAVPEIPAYLPDYRGQPLDVAFTDVVRQHYGLAMLVDPRGVRVRVQTLSDWRVVQQSVVDRSVVFEIKRIR
jgi:hypothetical protein